MYQVLQFEQPWTLKALSNLSDTTVRRSAVDQEPKTVLEIRKTTIFLWVTNNSIIYKFFKDFTNHTKKTNRTVVFRCP